MASRAAAQDAGLARLIAERDGLRQALDLRLQADARLAPAKELVLVPQALIRLPHTLVRYDFDRTGLVWESPAIHLRQRGGRWLAPSIDAISAELASRLVIHGAETSALRLTPEGLEGRLSLTLSQTTFGTDTAWGLMLHHTDSYLKPVTPWTLMHLARAEPRPLRLEVQVAPRPKAMILDLEIPDQDSQGVKMTFEESTKPVSGPRRMHVVVQHDGHAAWMANCVEWWWNKGLHDVDIAELRWEGRRLHGSFAITYQPDGYIPDDGRKRRQTYHLDLPVVAGRIDGMAKASGEFGDYPCRIRGRAWQGLVGTYTAHTVDGPRSGRLLAGISEGPADVPAGVGSEDAPALLRQIRALHLALNEGSLDYAEALARCQDPGPQPQADSSALMAATCAAASRPVVRQQGLCGPEDPDFGPFLANPTALPADGAVPVVPAAGTAQQWVHLSRWRWLGPFPAGQARGAWLPPVADLPAVPWRDGACGPWTWQDAVVTQPSFLPRDLFPRLLAAEPPAFVWYAVSTVKSPVAQKVWLALPATPLGRLWLNEVLVWEGGARTDSHLTAVIQVDLAPGENRILVQNGSQGMLYPGKSGRRQAPMTETPPRAGISVWMCLGGAPRPATGAMTQRQAEQSAVATARQGKTGWRNDGSGLYPEARPPRHWNLKTGASVAWQKPLACTEDDPVARSGRLWVVAPTHRLVCLDQPTGEILWKVAGGGGGSATPLATDQAVFIACGNGTAEAYDHAGKLRWSSPTGLTWEGSRGPAPMLAGDRLIVHGLVTQGEGPTRTTSLEVQALDAASGRPLWRTRLPTSVSGLVTLPVSDGRGSVWVVATVAGQILGADDGRILHDRFLGPVKPMGIGFDGATLAYLGPGWKASARLFLDHGRVGLRVNFISAGPSKYFNVPPLLWRGFMHVACTTNEHHMEFNVPITNLHTYRADDGAQTADIKPLIDDATQASSLILAGGLVFCHERGGPGQWSVKHPRPLLAVAESGPFPSMYAMENDYESTLAGPALDGERLFIVGGGRIHCVIAVDQAARQREEELGAMSLFARFGPRPVHAGAKPITPAPLRAAPAGLRADRLRDRCMPDHWLQLGPMPHPDGGDPWQAFGGVEKAIPVPGQGLTLGSTEFRWAPVDRSALVESGGPFVHSGYAVGYQNAYRFDLGRLTGKKFHSTILLATVVESVEDGTWQVNFGGQGLQAWLSGKPLVQDSLVSLPRGFYPLLVRLDIAKLPPIERQMLLYVRFLRNASPAEQLDRWLERTLPYRERLERIVRIVPDTYYGKESARILEELASRHPNR